MPIRQVHCNPKKNSPEATKTETKTNLLSTANNLIHRWPWFCVHWPFCSVLDLYCRMAAQFNFCFHFNVMLILGTLCRCIYQNYLHLPNRKLFLHTASVSSTVKCVDKKRPTDSQTDTYPILGWFLFQAQ